MAASVGLSVGPRSRSTWDHGRPRPSQPVVALHRLGGPAGRRRVLGGVAFGGHSGGPRVPPLGSRRTVAFFGPPHGACARSPALVGRRHRPIHAHVASHQTPRRRHPSTGMDGRAMGGGCLGRRLVWGAVWHRQMERRPRHRVSRSCGTALPHSIWGLPPQRVHPRVHGQRLGRRPTRLPNPASQRAMVQGLQPSAVG